MSLLLLELGVRLGLPLELPLELELEPDLRLQVNRMKSGMMIGDFCVIQSIYI